MSRIDVSDLAHHHFLAYIALQSLVAGVFDVPHTEIDSKRLEAPPKVVAVQKLLLLLHLQPDDLTRAKSRPR